MRVPYSLERPDIMKAGTQYRTIALGICQVETVPWDLQGNLSRLKQTLTQAAVLGVTYAITPECVLHGYADMQQPGSAALLGEQAR